MIHHHIVVLFIELNLPETNTEKLRVGNFAVAQHLHLQGVQVRRSLFPGIPEQRLVDLERQFQDAIEISGSRKPVPKLIVERI